MYSLLYPSILHLASIYLLVHTLENSSHTLKYLFTHCKHSIICKQAPPTFPTLTFTSLIHTSMKILNSHGNIIYPCLTPYCLTLIGKLSLTSPSTFTRTCLPIKCLNSYQQLSSNTINFLNIPKSFPIKSIICLFYIHESCIQFFILS